MMSRRVLLTAIAAAMTGGSALAENSEGQFVTEAFVNGAGPFAFIVDTGTSWTCVSSQLARDLGLPLSGAQSVMFGDGRAEARVTRLDRLQVANLAGNVESVLVLPHDRITLGAQGMIGSDVLFGQSVRLDFERGRIAFGVGASGGEAHIPLAFSEAGLPYATMRRRGIEAPALIDTGASHVHTNRALAARLFFSRTRETLLQDWALSDAPMPVVRARISNPAILGSEPGLVLGMALWRRFGRMTLDYAGAELRLPMELV